MEITKTAFLQIKGILDRGHYDIEGLYEVGLPSDFYEKTGISDDLFNSFYKLYKDKSKDVVGNDNVNVDANQDLVQEINEHSSLRAQMLNSSRFWNMDSSIESAIRSMSTATLNTISTSNTITAIDTPEAYTVVTPATSMPHSYTYYV